MFLTESKAKDKLCPILSNGIGESASCVTSNCMAWRWEIIDDYSEGANLPFKRETMRGYCGLAGKR